MRHLQVHITGMTCAACSVRIEKSLGKLEGVKSASVSLATSRASVEWDGGEGSDELIAERIRKLGYGADLLRENDGKSPETETKAYRNRFVASTLLSLPLFAAMAGHFLGPAGVPIPEFVYRPFVQMALASLLLLYAAYPFYLGAYHALKQRMPNMDVLIAMSTSVAFFYSQYRAFRPEEGHDHALHGHPALYFDSIAMILVSVTLGKWLESIAKGNAAKSLSALRELRADTVRLVRGRARSVIPIGELRPGERFEVVSSEWVPVDGTIVEGVAETEEAMLTGEAELVFKQPGERVYAGTRLISGRLIVESDQAGEQTKLSRMIAFVENAQHSKPRIERSVDRVAAVFVPAILALSAATFVGWLYAAGALTAIDHAMAVLLVACPCALGLATPISMLIGSSLALRSGIVVKEASKLEALSQANVFLFDKTGTLTRGQPAVADISAPVVSPMLLLRLAASLEQHSDHPLALSVVKEAQVRRLLSASASDVTEVPGRGIGGLVEGRRVLLGRAAWLEEQGVRLPASPPPTSSAGGHSDSVLHCAFDGSWMGSIRFRDPVREDALETLRALETDGELWMATGDRREAAEAIAASLAIPNVRAELHPEQKLELLRELRGQGKRVVMIGDGANDSPALAAADVGIALAGGNESALQAGDIVVVGNRLSRIRDGFRIARSTMRNVKQNLLLALLYNAVMIPLAVIGVLDPRIACVGMASSSLIVVGNSLRLSRLRPARPAKEAKR
ncbi:heavy metal translocating P-type ATPase [Cohnella fermenti]|nr:cation-translocating P-type ATPase [Cohnella fermenti]